MSEKQMDMFQYWKEVGGAEEDIDPRSKTPLQMVKEYHETADLPIGCRYDKLVEDDLSNLRLRLIQEETGEVFDAVNNAEDPEEVLKELADVVYVIYGTAVTYGWDLDMALLRVHDNNMGRMYQPDGTIKRRDDGKIIRNKEYPSVDLSDLVT